MTHCNNGQFNGIVIILMLINGHYYTAKLNLVFEFKGTLFGLVAMKSYLNLADGFVAVHKKSVGTV